MGGSGLSGDGRVREFILSVRGRAEWGVEDGMWEMGLVFSLPCSVIALLIFVGRLLQVHASPWRGAVRRSASRER